MTVLANALKVHIYMNYALMHDVPCQVLNFLD